MKQITTEDDDPASSAPAGTPAAGTDAAGGGDPAVSTEQAQELARFLRHRRSRISPQQVGFPVGPRRRSTGLRREEVAVLAGVSPTWYTYLEQGRKIRPSPEVLDSLAQVLALTEDERRYIHLLALGHPPANAGRSPAATDEALLWAVVRSIGAGPDPVYIGNQYGDVLAWNDATVLWFTDFARYDRPQRNMLWWLLTDPAARDRVLNWEDDTRDVIARLRAAYATRPHDPRFNHTITMLSDVSAHFRDCWRDHDVSDQRPRLRTLRAPDQGVATFRVVVLRVADDSANSVLVHLPVG